LFYLLSLPRIRELCKTRLAVIQPDIEVISVGGRDAA
jgi:hypothetical protein